MTTGQRPTSSSMPTGSLSSSSLRVKTLLLRARRQPVSFWAVTLYIFFEYVRPQTIYPWFDFLPWASICLTVAVVAALGEADGKRRWVTIDSALAVYSGVVLLSILFAYDIGYGIENLGVYVNWLALYFVLTSTLTTQDRFHLFLLSFFLWNLKMTSHAVRSWAAIGFSFRAIGTGGAPGWFQNSGEFGIQMCVIFPIALYYALGMRPFVNRTTFLLLLVLPVTSVMGAIASSSRGALLGIAGVALWALLKTKYKVRAMVATAVIAVGAIAIVPAEQMARLGDSGTDVTSLSRLTYWERGIEITNAHPILGVGYYNWLPYYRTHYTGWIQLSHNIFIQCMSELGYVGLACLLGLFGATLTTNARTRRLARRLGREGRLALYLAHGLDGALIGFIVSGFFVTVLYYPYLWVNLGMTAALCIAMSRHSRKLREMRVARARTDQAQPLNRITA